MAGYQASVIIELFFTSDGGDPNEPAAACGMPLSGNARYLKGAISDLRFKN